MDSEKTTVLESASAQDKGASKKDHAPTLYFIAICKLAKGVVLLLVAAGIYWLAGRDLQDDFDKFLAWVHLDPEHWFFHNISESLATITPGNIRATSLATFLYGMFLITGGAGLAARARWAIWLTIGEAAFFIPIEVFELTSRRVPRLDAGDEPHPHMFPHPKIGLLIVLVLNILIVCYLYRNRQRLFRHWK